jgi:cell fate (sporulation/competence/biofilm development) regulator YlbF (YheA/YmcA/DUF963 family)
VTHINQAQAPISSTVQDAIREFAAAVEGTSQFAAFEESGRALQNDQAAISAIHAYQSKQQSLQMMLMLNAVSEDERNELEQLRQAVFDNPTITGYVQAQDRLTALCLASAALLSEKIGLEFSVKRGGCCG